MSDSYFPLRSYKRITLVDMLCSFESSCILRIAASCRRVTEERLRPVIPDNVRMLAPSHCLETTRLSFANKIWENYRITGLTPIYSPIYSVTLYSVLCVLCGIDALSFLHFVCFLTESIGLYSLFGQ